MPRKLLDSTTSRTNFCRTITTENLSLVTKLSNSKYFPPFQRSSILTRYVLFLRHFLAGGKTVKEVLELAEEIEKIRKALVPICTS
jgi:hypothetical protein